MSSGVNIDIDLLLRISRPLDIAAERDEETESWRRGREAADEATVDPRDETGVALVQLPDGDPHATVLVEAAGDDQQWAGGCDCDGYRMHKKPCAHLVVRAVRSVLNHGEVPTDAEVYRQLASTPEEDDATATDGGDALSDVGGLDTASEVDASEELVDVPADATNAPSMPNTAGDPFAAELRSNVPERYVMSLGGEPYIRRAGYAAIARQAGLRVHVEAVTPAEDTEFQHARYRATVHGPDGDVLGQDFGTAHLDSEDLSGAEAQLDELAATRACRRAIEWATGAGATLRRDNEQ